MKVLNAIPPTPKASDVKKKTGNSNHPAIELTPKSRLRELSPRKSTHRCGLRTSANWFGHQIFWSKTGQTFQMGYFFKIQQWDQEWDPFALHIALLHMLKVMVDSGRFHFHAAKYKSSNHKMIARAGYLIVRLMCYLTGRSNRILTMSIGM